MVSPLSEQLSRWGYTYMNPTFKKGARNHKLKNSSEPRKSKNTGNKHDSFEELTHNDLYPVPTDMKAHVLHSQFSELYYRKNTAHSSVESSLESTVKERKNITKKNKKLLVKSLWNIIKKTYVAGGICQLITVLAQVAQPLIVMQILMIIEQNPKQQIIKEGLPYIILLYLDTVLNGLCTNRHNYLAYKSGVKLRSCVVSAIYQHSLMLSPKGKSEPTVLKSGEITNLVANDAQKLFELLHEGHLIWSCPLCMILVTALLIRIIGLSSLVGMLCMLLMLPLVRKIVSSMIHIRNLRVKESDKRIDVTTAMLQGIKVTKLNNYEEKFKKRIFDIRKEEMKYCRKELSLYGHTMFLTVSTPLVGTAATFITYVLIDKENILTPSLAFTTLILFSALRFPINHAGKLIGKAAQGLQAIHRINCFLSRDVYVKTALFSTAETESDTASFTDEAAEESSEEGKIDDKLPVVEVTNGTFYYNTIDSSIPSTLDHNQPSFSLRGVNFSVKKGEILAIIGPVGSGKSTLVNGLINEVSCTETTHITKRVPSQRGEAYAGQIPFILNSTVRENILFGSSNDFDQDRYDLVLDACCLRPDIKLLGGAGDMTEIGERGITLSGGQKQRVSLARAAYAKPGIVYLDDPFSALDNTTGKKVFEGLLGPESSLFNESAVVLVTHSSHILPKVDKILVLSSEGSPQFLGGFQEFMDFDSSESTSDEFIKSVQLTIRQDEELKSITPSSSSLNLPLLAKKKGEMGNGEDTTPKKKSTIMTKEEREHGISSWRTWALWFYHAGGFWYISLCAIGLGLDRATYVIAEYFLAFWTQSVSWGKGEQQEFYGVSFYPQSESFSEQLKYLTGYCVIMLMSFAFTIFRAQWIVSGGARCAERLSHRMTTDILTAQMQFFETTPLGRILNRFTYDLEVLDTLLTQSMSITITATGWFFAGVTIMVIILPWIILVIVPVTGLYALLQLYYRKSATDLQRLDAVSRSPLQAQLSETIDGMSTIKVYQKQKHFTNKFRSSLDNNSTAMLNFISGHRWLAVRIELLGSIIGLASTGAVVFFNHILQLDPGLVALLIIWSSNFTITLAFLVDSISESDAAITSIERVVSISSLPKEKSKQTDPEYQVPESWPKEGALSFDNVHMRYRKNLPLALEGLSFELKPGMKCGVVGRTGAGKSTITTALFRLVEIEKGKITLDGIDLSKLGLSDIRGRKRGMAIIPQDPVLFAGTLRELLDPFGESQDKDIFDALVSVRIARPNEGFGVLDNIVEEGGSNYSVGERQLLCLARAILSEPKLLVLDEATASVDGETDIFLQKMLRSKFEGCTLLTIAHRISTVLDYDMILAMDKGKAVEFGPPEVLMEKEDGVFRALLNSGDKEGEE